MSTPETFPETPQPNGADMPVAEEPKAGTTIERIRLEPDFAVDAYKKIQSYNTKLEQRLKALEEVERLATSAGGANVVAQTAYEHSALIQHPAVAEIARHYRTYGTLPTAAAPKSETSEDEYQDPVEVMRGELAQLREQLQMVSGHVQRDRTLIAQTATHSNLQKIADEFGDDWEVIQPHVAAKAEEWEKTPQGREILSTATPATWRNLANLVRGEHMDDVLTKRAEKRVRQQEALGTEPRPQNVTTGREDPILRQEPHRQGAARRLVESIRRREGRPV